MKKNDSAAARCFAGEGEMVDAMCAMDWSQSPLGPVDSWPASIRTAVGICLASHFQLVVLSGPELIYLYNDATIPIFGDKHPWALGRRVADVWPEAWPMLDPMLQHVLQTGRTLSYEDLLMVLERKGFPEECYFTLSYSPIRTGQSSPDGVFVATVESTARVLSERRQRTLSDLAGKLALHRGDTHTFDAVRQALADNPYDVPVAALYLAAGNGGSGELAFCSGLGDGAAFAGSVSFPAEDPGPGAHPASRAAARMAPQLVDAQCLVAPGQRCGAWPEPLRQILALPFTLPGQARLRGVLLLGANPRCMLDTGYRAFMDAVLAHVVMAAASVDAIGAERRRAAELEYWVARRSEELREANQLLTAMFDRAPSGITILDQQLRIVRVNAACQLIIGYSESELLGQQPSMVSEEGDYAWALEQVALLRADKINSFEVEVRCTRADGKEIWVDNFFSMIRDQQGAPSYFVSVFQDVTERKRVEAERLGAQRELRVLYERLQTVREAERLALAREVHDQLGQLLSAAKIDIKLLEDDLRAGGRTLAPEDILAELRSAGGTLDRGLQLVRQIATEMRGPKLDDDGLYATLAWHARDFERRTRIKTAFEAGVGLPQPAPAAATALLGIFQEAMTNVLRHAQAGQVWVSLDRRADALLLRVRDDGGGTRRQRRTSTRSLGMTGMYERAALAGGRVAVGPLKPRGSLVSALIPLQGAPRAATNPTHPRENQQP